MTLVRPYNKSEHRTYRGKDYMEKFCKDLKTLAMEVINYEKEEMIPLTDEKNKHYESRKYCHICRRKIDNNKDSQKYKKY